jgi:hypothetical protein
MTGPIHMKGRFSTINIWFVLSIVALLVAAAGLACGKGDETTGTTVSTAKEMAPVAPVPSSGSSGGTMSVDVPATPTETVEGGTSTSDDTVTGADDGMPTVVYTHDEVGPCEGGMQEVTHYTEYSDGTSASSISMQPCGDDISPVEE